MHQSQKMTSAKLGHKETLDIEVEHKLPFLMKPKAQRFSLAINNTEERRGQLELSINELKVYYDIERLKNDNYSDIADCYAKSQVDYDLSIYRISRIFKFQKYRNRILSNASEDEYISKFDSIQLKDCPELVYICDTMDFLQDIEFKYMIWTGPNLYQAYPIMMSYRKKIIMFLMTCQMIFNSDSETYQMAIAIFDQCLYRMGKQDIDNCNKMALIAFFIAHKVEEVSFFPLSRIMDLAGNKFTESELCEMERDMVQCLNFNLYLPIPINYLRAFILMEKPTKFKYVYEAGKFFMDICLWNTKFGGYPYSVNNAVCYCVAMHVINNVKINEFMWKDYFRNLTGLLWNDISYHINRFIRTFHNLVQKQKMNYYITIHKTHTNLNKEFVRDLLTLFYDRTNLDNNVLLDFCAVCSYTEKYKNYHYETQN